MNPTREKTWRCLLDFATTLGFRLEHAMWVETLPCLCVDLDVGKLTLQGSLTTWTLDSLVVRFTQGTPEPTLHSFGALLAEWIRANPHLVVREIGFFALERPCDGDRPWQDAQAFPLVFFDALSALEEASSSFFGASPFPRRLVSIVVDGMVFRERKSNPASLPKLSPVGSSTSNPAPSDPPSSNPPSADPATSDAPLSDEKIQGSLTQECNAKMMRLLRNPKAHGRSKRRSQIELLRRRRFVHTEILFDREESTESPWICL